MDRQEALEELKLRLSSPNLIKHSLAVEAIMRSIARFYNEEEDKWGLAGLMHDIDYERTADDPSMHSLEGARMLEDLGFDDAIVYAVKAHNDFHGVERKRKMDKALYSADPLSGLITAAALILPSRKLSDVTAESVLRRMNEKGFAKGANREQIRKCTELDMTLDEFVDIALNAMKGIADDLGL